jgi:tRNA modification GTPase
VGKSSLLNALTGEDRAIVTPVAGTTRDFVEGEFFLEGIRVTLIDTAGLRHTEDTVEKIGVERTLQKFASVDLVLYVLDGIEGVVEGDHEFLAKLPWEKTAVAFNKIDAAPGSPRPASDKGRSTFYLSAKDGQGLETFKSWLATQLRSELAEDSMLMSNSRHYQGLQTVAESLSLSIELLKQGHSPDLIALELQAGLRALHEILGITFDDQVMDRVFSEFCLGK